MAGATVAIVGAGLQLLGGIFGGGAAKKRERAAAREKQKLQRKLTNLENNRLDITNPFAGVSDLSGLAMDLSSNLTNPFENLSVATKAAEMQVEEADISLANTLDTIRATGASAGGATALAQAALQSKKGVSASIEQQEANNERLKAQGEQQLQRMKMQESARVQGIQIAEGGRTQALDAAGRQFVFRAQEDREGQRLDRVSAQLAGAEARAMQASAARQANTAGIIGGLASIGGSLVTGLAQQGASGAGSRNMATAMDTSGMQVGYKEFGPSGINLNRAPTGGFGIGGMSTIPTNTPVPSINTNYTPSFLGSN